MSIALIIDIIVSILLVVTIGYAVVLNKRLGNLRRDRSELEKLAINFHASTARADESIARLRSSVDSLQDQLKKAESMRDDLIFLTERGSAAADHLEDMVRMSRGEAPLAEKPKQNRELLPEKPQPVAKAAAQAADLKANSDDRINSEPVSEAEKELLKALRSAS